MRRFLLSILFPFLFLAPRAALPHGAVEPVHFRIEVPTSDVLAAWLGGADPAGRE